MVEGFIPVIPSSNLDKSLELWVDGLGFQMDNEMRNEDGRLVFCMLHRGEMHLMLNQRVGPVETLDGYEGIRLYWAPTDIQRTRDRLKRLGFDVSEIERRDYGQTEFFLTDDDGYSHCFGVRTSN